MKDTLQQALIRIDRLHRLDSIKIEKLQHQFDSLKSLPITEDSLLQDRLDQASETINNLGTAATTWGTKYTIIGVIIAVLTALLAIATFLLPYWIRKRNKKAINKLDKKYDEKLKMINEDFNKKYEQLSNTNSLQLQELNSEFASKTQELDKRYDFQTRRIESNFNYFLGRENEINKYYNIAFAFSNSSSRYGGKKVQEF